MDKERRNALLSNLLELVLERGFATLTMDDFAAHARCSKTTLYSLGSSKETLVATLYRRFFREATESIEDRIQSNDSERERIADYLSGVGDEMSRMSSSCYDDMIQLRATRDIYEVNSKAAADRVRSFIERGIAGDEFRDTNARFLGEAVWLLIEGILHGVLLQRTGLSSGQAYNEIGTLVLNALDKAPAPRASSSRT
jgi:AcrR family transcriptional regulator